MDDLAKLLSDFAYLTGRHLRLEIDSNSGKVVIYDKEAARVLRKWNNLTQAIEFLKSECNLSIER